MIKDYLIYELSSYEKFIYYTAAFILAEAMAILFFDNWVLGIIITPLAYVAKSGFENFMAGRRLYKLRTEFIDFLYSISASVAAGVHMQEALEEARDELKLIDKNTKGDLIDKIFKKSAEKSGVILPELEEMLFRMATCNENERVLLYDFASRTGLDDLKNFVENYYSCRDSGGNLVETVNRSVQIITDKLLIEKDMKTLISQKVFEGRLIAVLPPAIIFCLRIASPEYMVPLYNTVVGRLIMLISAGAMVFAFYYANRLKKVVFKETLESALPEFLSRLSMLLGSGMVLQTALEKLATEESKTQNILLNDFRELYFSAVRENLPVLWKFRSYAVQKGSRELIRCCGIMSAGNSKGTELVEKLENESAFMWHSAKKQIEEKSKLAETKMTFPMSLMLIVLILITTAPALMGL